MATALLPRSPLGRLRAVAVSPDLQWLAISERNRGGVWNLGKGDRVFYVRGFRGAYFGEDGVLYADFPKLDATERNVARLHLARREVAQGTPVEDKESRAHQHGQFLVSFRPVKKGGSFEENVVLEVRDARSGDVLWSRNFPKEAPDEYADPREGTMVLRWAVSTGAAKAAIKENPALKSRLAAMKEKEGDYFIQVLDLRSGKVLGQLLIETGKGSFRIASLVAAGDWVVMEDTANRILVYSLSTGEQKGRVFGDRAAISKTSGLLCVENVRGQVAIYDLATFEKRDQFVFTSPVSVAEFGHDGQRLFVLTANQTAYVFDLSGVIRQVRAGNASR